jgi:3-hydroxybutyryl-CoA dehydratase
MEDTAAAELAALPAHLQAGYRFSRIHCFDPAQVSAFACAAGDTNPLHHDARAAAESRFGKPIASGTHTSALLMGLVAAHYANLGQVVGVKFTIELLRPVLADEQVTLEWEVIGVRPHRLAGHYLDLAGSVSGTDGRCRVLAWE